MKTGTGRVIARKDGAIGWMVFDNPARRNAMRITFSWLAWLGAVIAGVRPS